MMKKDHVMKDFFSSPVRFADFMNALFFDGHDVIPFDAQVFLLAQFEQSLIFILPSQLLSPRTSIIPFSFFRSC